MSTYPKLYTFGHRAIDNLFLDEVEIEEKVDGSQFSWGNVNGELQCFSKNCKLHEGGVPDLFKGAVDTARRLHDAGFLPDGVTFRGEAMKSGKHNTLCYDRAPKGNVILFDVMMGPERYVEHAEKAIIADTFEIEVVPLLFKGLVTDMNMLKTLLDTVSILGGQKVEGVVFKNYARFGIDGKPLFGKLVSDAFKEVHNREWKTKTAPGKNEIIEQLVLEYNTPARWNKAVQHLRDAGRLTESAKDIGPLMGECAKDIHAECMEELKEKLFKWAWPQIARGCTNGIPLWYKRQLEDANPANFAVVPQDNDQALGVAS